METNRPRGMLGNVADGGVGDAGSGDGSGSSGSGVVCGAVDEGLVDQPGPLKLFYEYGGYVELGFEDWPVRYDLEQFRDEVAVRVDSVLVRDGVLRGLVQNMSRDLFARAVSVSVDGKRWVFPLTVQPTEVVPFAVEGYEGPSDPEVIEFGAATEFVSDPDPRRSFFINGLPGHHAQPWGGLRLREPNYAGDEPPEGTTDEDLVRYYRTGMALRVSSTHPSIAGEVMGQTIEDLRVYLTKMDADGKVLDIREMVPYLRVAVGVNDDGSIRLTPTPVDRLPFMGWTDFEVGFMGHPPEFAFTVGGAYDDAGG